MKRWILAGATALALVGGQAEAKTFKWAYQGDIQSLDPQGLQETFTLGFLGNVYEALTHYDTNLKLEPALATSWENTDPTHWVFHLREGVTFHNGDPFTADDVIFTWKRSLTPGSDLKGAGGKMSEIEKIDDHTIKVTTPTPNPILPRDLPFFYIMSHKWAEENNATQATSPAEANSSSTYASTHENGTGPFIVTGRQPDVKTTFKRFDGYWDKDLKTNVDEVVFTPISEDATRTAALISGDLDLVFPVPVQDWQRLEDAKGVKPLHGPDARTIFLGMDQFRDELLYSDVKGKNPLKDKDVRGAIAHAIDLKAIDEKVMRGAANPAGLLIGPQINGFSKDLAEPYAYDPKQSKELLDKAGYPDGFQLGMDCPNNRYVNDELVCRAVASYLAKIGIKVDLNAQPKAKYFAKVGPQNGNDTSFYLLGWTPTTFDAQNTLFNIVHSFDKAANAGQFNYGHYSNTAIDDMITQIDKETDEAKRQSLIDEAFKTLKDDYGILPIHQQPLSWGVKDTIDAPQRPDDVLDFRYVTMP
ncbi:ABC transporter substrate-binding protein [Mangrovibrevibacter kandeliae]|uniref:ABC transporter substrate-binding protein n=1 Tax=Mangrovibrevibacter kandeliae TaxID=2968473 RepID=UPI002117C41A|nr:ABC transporter substrate-binding protein [Aurantimonas sp. CSK15Z-1]MCQ8781869.1 ABC transporter substrate-binding protein [Aurantimonas sp. CSK15Z-1]